MSRRCPSLAAAALLLALAPRAATGEEHRHEAPPAAAPAIVRLTLPDVEVVDHLGHPRRFVRDLVDGRVVAVSFVFTSCTTVCLPIGATFGRLREMLGERAGRDVHLVSVSIDPATDTPARLAAWAAKFGGGPGWTLATGEPSEITRLLRAFGVYSADRDAHAPVVMVGDGHGGWTRVSGLAPAATLAAVIDGMASRPAPAAMRAPAPPPEGAAQPPSAAHAYFPDTVLLDQDGREVRFYSDLLRGRTAIMDFVFTRCTGVCPLLSRAFVAIQQHLGDRLGKDVVLLSISVDPAHDTPARLKEYAARFAARPGWRFLTGRPEDDETVLRQLGQWVETPESHQNLILLGNDRTGLWKKAFGLAPESELLTIVDSVVDDRGGA